MSGCPFYCPPANAVPDPSGDVVLSSLVSTHPLATLVWAQDDGVLVVDHVPLLYDAQRKVLEGHVARANPIWKRAKGKRILAVFRGPDGYLSPSWYPSKAVHGKHVPTWDYAVAIMHGTLTPMEDPAWLPDFLNRLTNAQEAMARSRDPEHHVWRVSDAPVEYVKREISAIVGIEIAVDAVGGKFKMSQKEDAADVRGAVEGLLRQGDLDQLADMMARVNDIAAPLSRPATTGYEQSCTLAVSVGTGFAVGLAFGYMLLRLR